MADGDDKSFPEYRSREDLRGARLAHCALELPRHRR